MSSQVRKTLRRVLVALVTILGVTLVASVVALSLLISATSTPEVIPRTGADPNATLQTYIAHNSDATIAKTNLFFAPDRRPPVPTASCTMPGRWSLDVNPEDAVGYPYPMMPSAQDWGRAADAVAVAMSICAADVNLTWVGHDRRHPISDRWAVLLPASEAVAINVTTLRDYVAQNERQL